MATGRVALLAHNFEVLIGVIFGLGLTKYTIAVAKVNQAYSGIYMQTQLVTAGFIHKFLDKNLSYYFHQAST